MYADARFVSVEVIGFEKADVVGGDDRNAGFARESERSLYAALLVGAPGSRKLQIEAIRKQREPEIESRARLGVVPGNQSLTDIPFSGARQRN